MISKNYLTDKKNGGMVESITGFRVSFNSH